MGFEAAHLAGGEVGDDDDCFAEELFGGVPLGYAGENLALFVAQIYFEAEELVGLGDAFGDGDLGYAELDFGEVVDGDELWSLGRGVGDWLGLDGWSGCSCGCVGRGAWRTGMPWRCASSSR